MKKFLAILVFAVVVAFAGFGTHEYRWSTNGQPFQKNHADRPQARYSHRLTFMNTYGDKINRCSGTAIGPHAVLTSSHCNPGVKLQSFNLDTAAMQFNILDAAEDGRDHVIYLIDGPALTDVDPYIMRASKMGEKVFLYGYGHGEYPAVFKTGVVIDEYDPSEVNARQGIFYCSISPVEGDSGAAIYGEDGAILSTVTYGLKEVGVIFTKIESSDFSFDFSPEVIVAAQKFNGKRLNPIRVLSIEEKIDQALAAIKR